MSENNGHKTHTKAYVAVWITLLVLTVITVEVSYHDYGTLNIAVAMLVATIKAALVCLFFMHLKYDNRINQVVFASSVLFLVIFVSLTLSDELSRPHIAQGRIKEIQGPSNESPAKMNQLRVSTPAMIAKGKDLFQVNCVTCHGATGHGDGPAAAALTPHPRNFTSADGWKNGRAPAQIFKTLKEGIPGSGMASFATLPVEDRWALVHYVHSLTPNPPADTPQTLALIGLKEGEENAKPAEEKVELPISFAIDRLVEEAGTK